MPSVELSSLSAMLNKLVETKLPEMPGRPTMATAITMEQARQSDHLTAVEAA
jgi:hypothetical protein